jgi:hypothetical protein
MEPRTSRWNSTTDLPSEPRLVVAILLELIPLFALAIGLVLIAIAAALDLDGPLSTWLLVIIALGVPFFAGGIGWFSIDERQWGWLVLLG